MGNRMNNTTLKCYVKHEGRPGVVPRESFFEIARTATVHPVTQKVGGCAVNRPLAPMAANYRIAASPRDANVRRPGLE